MNHYHWGHDKKMGSTEKLTIWLVVICGLACATPIIGWFGFFAAKVVDQYQNQELPHVATFEEKEFLGSEIARLQEVAINDPDYFAFEFVRDRIYLVELMDKYNLRESHDGCIKSLYELSTKTVKEARQEGNDRLFLMQDHKWRNEFMDAEVELGVITVGDKEVLRGIKKISLTLLLWYLKFIPFAFIVLLVRLKFDDRFKIKEELLLDCKKPILWSIFWPVGFVCYPDTQTAVYFRYLKLKSIYQATKGYDWNHQFSEREEAELQAKALQRITNFDQAVADLASVPIEEVKRQSRLAAIITLLMSAFVTPFSFGFSQNKQGGCKPVFVQIIKTNDNQVNFDSIPDLSDGSDDTIVNSNHHQPAPVAIMPQIPTLVFSLIKAVTIDLDIRPPPGPVFPVDHVPKIKLA